MGQVPKGMGVPDTQLCTTENSVLSSGDRVQRQRQCLSFLYVLETVKWEET